MDDKSIMKSPIYNQPNVGKTNSNNKGKFEFFTLPFFGPSVICIIIIGGPRGFYKIFKNVGQRIQTQLLKNTSQKKLGSGLSGKPLLIPAGYGALEGLLSGIRGVDDDVNVLTAGTLTGLLYKASTGNLYSCGVGGLTGLLLSSLYCSLKPRNFEEIVEKNLDLEKGYHESLDDDYWKPS